MTADRRGEGFAWARQQCLDPRWVILVGRSGAFLYRSTEAEAEEMRCFKATREQAIAKKRTASFQDVSLFPSTCWNHPGFVNRYRYADCRCGSCTT